MTGDFRGVLVRAQLDNWKRKINNKTALWDAFASKWQTDWWVGGCTVFGRMGMDWRTSSLCSASHACHSHSHRVGTIYRHSIRCSIVLFGNEPTGMERPSHPLVSSARPALFTSHSPPCAYSSEMQFQNFFPQLLLHFAPVACQKLHFRLWQWLRVWVWVRVWLRLRLMLSGSVCTNALPRPDDDGTQNSGHSLAHAH